MISILSKKIFYIICFTLFLPNNLGYCQIIGFKQTENKFSIAKLQKQSDSSNVKNKLTKEDAINMKIPIYIGLISGVTLALIGALTTKSSVNSNGETMDVLSPGLGLIMGFAIGCTFGFFITGAVMEAKKKNKEKEESNHLNNLPLICTPYDSQNQKIILFKYSYGF